MNSPLECLERGLILAFMALLVFGPLLSPNLVAQSAIDVVPIEWDAPTTNEDGTPLTDLHYYRLYIDREPIDDDPTKVSDTAYTESISAEASQTVVNLPIDKDWPKIYMRLRACDLYDNCSKFSNQVDHIINDGVAPSAPTIRKALIVIRDRNQ